MWKTFAIKILCITLVSASCPKNCRCPPEAPTCTRGVSLVLDSCGCCKVCARQLFEDCSKTLPCDTAKGLECNFGGGHSLVKGVCRAKLDGRTCDYNSKIYQNGEIFQPNCKHQCTCMDGAVGCVSLCPHQLSLPKLGCTKPKWIKLVGGCCEQLVCPQETKRKSTVFNKYRGMHTKDQHSENDSTRKNELPHVWRGKSKSFPDIRNHPVGHITSRGVQCVSTTTPWTSCSKSCSTGVSTRLSNINAHCTLMKETRVCEVRPCKPMTLKKSQKCNPTEKASHPMELSYAGCRSLKKFQPVYCGSCSDGRCCRPHTTHTLPVRFQCRNGQTFQRLVMMIESCRCNFTCSSSHKTPPVLYDLFNHIYKQRL